MFDLVLVVIKNQACPQICIERNNLNIFCYDRCEDEEKEQSNKTKCSHESTVN